MPELPEVEGYRKYLTATAMHQRIVSAHSDNEGRMLADGMEALRKATVGKSIIGTDRVGKYLFLKLAEENWMMWHFGLTGAPAYYTEVEASPRFTRIWFELESGHFLGFVSMRKFSRLRLTHSVADFQKAYKIGPDALQAPVEHFVRGLQKRKLAIKTALLDQKLVAGIGNWIADEMLYQARIYPEVPCYQLGEEQLIQLHSLMQEIMQTAIRREAHYDDFPAHFMVPARWAKGDCPACGTKLVRIVVGGRGTFYCPSCQTQKSPT